MGMEISRYQVELNHLTKNFATLNEQYRSQNWKIREVEEKLEKTETSCKEMKGLKEQFERRFLEMSKNNSLILASLIEITKRAQTFEGENQELVEDLKKISKKIVKTHLRGNIFKKYKDMIGITDEQLDQEEEEEDSDNENKAELIMKKVQEVLVESKKAKA